MRRGKNSGALIAGHIIRSVVNSEEHERAHLWLREVIMRERVILVTCHVTVTKYPDKSHLGKEVCFGTQSRAWVCHVEASTVAGVWGSQSHGIYNPGAEGDGCWVFGYFPSFYEV